MPALVCNNFMPMGDRPLPGSFEHFKDNRMVASQDGSSPAQRKRSAHHSAPVGLQYNNQFPEDYPGPSGANPMIYGESGAPYLNPVPHGSYMPRYPPYDSQLVQQNVSIPDNFLSSSSRYRDNIVRHGGYNLPHDDAALRRQGYGPYRQIPTIPHWHQPEYAYEGYSGIGVNNPQNFRPAHFGGMPEFRGGYYDENPQPIYGTPYMREFESGSTEFVPYNSNFIGNLGHAKPPSIEEKVEKQIDKLTSRRPKRARRAKYQIEPAYGYLNSPLNRAMFPDLTSRESPITKIDSIKAAETHKPKEGAVGTKGSSLRDDKVTDQGSSTEELSNFTEKDSRVEEDVHEVSDEGDTEGRRKRNPHATSKYRGVSWNKANQSWKACIKVKGKNIHIGYFEDDIDAAKAYDIVAQQYRGDRAKVNFPESRIAFANTLQGLQ